MVHGMALQLRDVVDYLLAEDPFRPFSASHGLAY